MSLKVLIVDDEEKMRKLIRTYLTREGYICLEAKDGFEALERLKKENPDMLIVDVMMPYIDGFTLVEEMRQYLQIDSPVIFLTAKGNEEDKVKGLKIGGDDYIVKPFHPSELLARMEVIFRRTHRIASDVKIAAIGPLQFDLQGRIATVEGRRLALTQKNLIYYSF